MIIPMSGYIIYMDSIDKYNTCCFCRDIEEHLIDPLIRCVFLTPGPWVYIILYEWNIHSRNYTGNGIFMKRVFYCRFCLKLILGVIIQRIFHSMKKDSFCTCWIFHMVTLGMALELGIAAHVPAILTLTLALLILPVLDLPWFTTLTIPKQMGGTK